jgi:thioredoxin 1
MMSAMDTPDSLHVACLCAAWCRLCDGYRPVLEQVEAELRAAGAAPRWHWIDIEDEAELVGELDVQTFPTIVVCDADHVRFAGPVTPQPETLLRLLRSLLLDVARDAAWPAVPPEVEDFAQRLRLR